MTRSSDQPAVIDASAWVEVLRRSECGHRVLATIGSHPLHAPAVFDAEVMNAVKGLERAGRFSADTADAVIALHLVAPIESHSMRHLLAAAWPVRHRLSTYDAMYVALARTLRCAVVTTDRRWERAGDLGVRLITVS